MKVALLQLNPTIGDVASNAHRIAHFHAQARDAGAELVVSGELSLCGYPPRDLLDRPELLRACDAATHELAALTLDGPALILGRPQALPPHPTSPHVPPDDPAPTHHTPGKPLANAVLLLDQGRVIAERHKSLLPDYDVFHESRHFRPAAANPPVSWRGRRLGLTVCEDLWNDDQFWPHRRYGSDPVAELAKAGIDLLINISASPWSRRKCALRRRMIAHSAQRHELPIVWVNQVGANDDLVFDGEALVFDRDGTLRHAGPPFEEAITFHDLDAPAEPAAPPMDDLPSLHAALVLGIRDYVRKCGFSSVLLGLSGGIDSAVTATLAVDALGSENVLGVALPSAISSQDSLTDAQELATHLGIQLSEVPIAPAYDTLIDTLAPLFAGSDEDVTEENLQSRIRGTLLMALSNKSGRLLLTTGNKSELAVGYCTLYGDMNGALAVIADVPKTLVQELARWMNRDELRIPWNTIEKPPSAELRPGQLDQDSLPPYEVLDDIIERWVEKRQDVQQIAAAGHDRETVRHVLLLLHINEYKRHQVAPVLKVTRRAFGSGWRMPLAKRMP